MIIENFIYRLTKDYKDKVDFYKVNIEKESDMAAMFGVRSVPTIVMMSKNTKPTQIPGVPHKESLAEIIDAFLEKDKNDS